MPELTENAKKQFKKLYSFQDETIEDTFSRVAKEFAKTEEDYKTAYDLLDRNMWRPNTPVFLNAGTDHKVFSACYVSELNDSMESIFDIADVARKIFQFGAGIGIPIGNLREKNAYIYEGKPDVAPEGRSSGPKTFMMLYDVVGHAVKSGGRVRRAAIMCSVPIWHPDVEEFITSKTKDGFFSNMNISVNVTDKFMQALKDKVPFDLNTPYDGSKIGEIDPQKVWDLIASCAWSCADPGIIFIDRMNEYNPLIEKHMIEATNPCVTGDTLISTPYGYKYVKDINEQDIIDTVCGTGFVKTKEMNEMVSVYKVKFSDGGSIKATAGHQFHAIKKGLGKKGIKKFTPIRLDNLEVGDWIRVNSTSIPNNKIDTKQYGLTNYEYGFLVGVLIGDKNVIKYNRVKIATNQDDEEWNNYLEEILYKVGYTGVKDLSNNSKSMSFHINGDSILLKIVKDLNIEGYSYEKRIPFYLLNSNASLLSGVINGIVSTDGNINKNKSNPLIRITTTSKGLVDDIRNILLMFGIHCCVGKDNKSNGNIDGRKIRRKHSKYDICIVGASVKTFYKNIIISHPDKMKKLEDVIINYNLSGNTWKTKIKSIEYIGEETVYDLYEPNTDTWITNGYVSRGCGEQPLIPFGCCNLSSINIAQFVDLDGEFDWDLLYNTTFTIMGLMDNIIDNMQFPEECADGKKLRRKDRFRAMTEKYRPVGIGIMGLGDALYMMDISYNSQAGRDFAAEVMRIMTTACVKKSALLAKEYGPFHQYNIHKENMERIIAEHIGLEKYEDDCPYAKEAFELLKEHGVRNMQFTTSPPTGTTALSCDASYGIEPIFGLTFTKNYIDKESVTLVNQIFYNKFKDEDWFTDNLVERIHKNNGSLKGIHGIPKEVRETFVVAHDIKYTDRIDMQARIQEYCSTAISSTVNLPKETTKEEIAEIYKYAYEKRLKGITIYRDGSKKNQPITFSKEENIDGIFKRPARLPSFVYKIETGNGKMYVTVSEYQGKPLEVFLDLGKSGQMINTLAEALSRVTSIALQNGVPVEEVTKTLMGINSDKPTWFRFEESDKKPTQILSIPDGVAKLLKRYYSGKKYDGELSGEPCPKCGVSMKAIEGCFSCVECGHSNCS